jgi:hypothetical protein
MKIYYKIDIKSDCTQQSVIHHIGFRAIGKLRDRWYRQVTVVPSRSCMLQTLNIVVYAKKPTCSYKYNIR